MGRRKRRSRRAMMAGDRGALYTEAYAWDDDPRNRLEIRSAPILEELLFHGDLRFSKYVQYQLEGQFASRLLAWLRNVHTSRERRSLLRLASRLLFVDESQTAALYRDAYRRCVVPWLEGPALRPEALSPEYDMDLLQLMRRASLFSVTSSFRLDLFLQVNDLSGLVKPRILGEDPTAVGSVVAQAGAGHDRVIVFEDFVGTGKQAAAVLLAVRLAVRNAIPVLFVPLLLLESGLERLSAARNAGVAIEPVLLISKGACVGPDGFVGEPPEYGEIRALVKQTAVRVCESFGPHDDPPKDPFGYGGSGALVVTAHNTPNNTLALIHHRSPGWSPLFRRLHHSKEGLV